MRNRFKITFGRLNRKDNMKELRETYFSIQSTYFNVERRKTAVKNHFSAEENFFWARKLIIFQTMELPTLQNSAYYNMSFSVIHEMGLRFGRKFLSKESTGKYAEPHVGKVDYFDDIIP